VAFAVAGRAESRSTRIAAGVLAVLADRLLAPRRPGGAFGRRAWAIWAAAAALVVTAGLLLHRRRRARRRGQTAP
jgi:hypothetical protein